ncbi:MAG: hypothetical protein IKI34_01165 [Eubacterium sp.]|nr:hypothetical protein [Eubacterium sp.]
MKILSKRILAIILSAVIALPCIAIMPFSATAAEETLNPSKYILITSSSSGSRGDGDNGCVVNDGSADNMSAMLWQFDLSGINRGDVINSASLTFDVWSINNRNIEGQQLDVWYFNPASYPAFSGYSNDSRITDTSLGYGDAGPASYRAAFGVRDDYYIGYREHNYDSDSATISFSNDALKSALNTAVDENWRSIVFVIMHNKTASSQWSDIWTGIHSGVAPSLTYSSTTLDDETYVKTKIASYGGENLSAKSDGIRFSSGGNSYKENVLYSANGNFDSDYFDGVLNGGNKLGFNVYPASSRVVYLVDSQESVIGYPLIAKVQKSQAAATTVHWGVNYLAIDSGENWKLNDDWFVCSNDRTWDTILDSQSDKAYGVNKINYDSEIRNHYNENIQVGSWGSHSEGHFTGDSPKTLSNTVYYDAEALDFAEDNYCAINNLPTFKANADGCGHWIGSQAAWNGVDIANSITINGKTNIDLRVLSVKPLKDIISSDDFIQNYSSISSNEDLYTKTSLANYYTAVANIMRFDVNSLDVSNDTALANASNEIKNLVDNYNANKTPERRADLSNLKRAYDKGNALLLSLDNKAARFSTTSINNLINALQNSDVLYYVTAEDTSDMGQADEEAANALAKNILAAYDALEAAGEMVDVSTYESAAATVNSIDKDAYNNTNSISSAIRIANILVKSTSVSYTDSTDAQNTSTIKALTGNATQQNIDDATRTILDALYVSIKSYTLTTNGAVVETSFQNGTSSGENSPYTVTYGATAIARSDKAETAWYKDFSSESTARGKQYQGYGDTFTTKILGNINIHAEIRTDETPNMICINRVYSNDSEKTPVHLITFVGDSYTLPMATAYPNYSFAGYDVNGEIKSENETISVDGDINIKALYTYISTDEYSVNATPLENGQGYNSSAAYNTSIEIKGGDGAYAWVEEIGEGKFRPFAIGSDITFFVSESVYLFAVTKAQFDSYNFTLPTINMRKTGYLVNGTKAVFNAQIVEEAKTIREYGVVIGIPKDSQYLDPEDVTVENAGSHENYDVIRAKSTKNVGANQFTVSVNGIAGKDFIYRGYVIYEKTSGEFVTVYN